MQRIDRELNASLDVGRAMRITLEWAMRQSKADAGFVGIVEEKGIRIMASQGYTTELAPYKDSYLPIQLPGLKEAIENGEQSFLIATNPNRGSALLTNGKAQITVPIRREQEVIGVLMLESSRPTKTLTCPSNCQGSRKQSRMGNNLS